MRKIFGLIVCLTWVTAACGGKGASPMAPSASTPAASSSAATISGSVVGAGASSLTADSIGSAMSGVTVTVVGTSISSAADAAGRFMLADVPPGSVQLRISGSGADATVSLEVQPTERVEVVLVVAGAAATVDAEVHDRGGDGELEGRVEALPPATPAGTFRAAGRTVKTDASTQFVHGDRALAFADLKVGTRVHAKGHLTGEAFTASFVEIQNPANNGNDDNETEKHDDGNKPDDPPDHDGGNHDNGGGHDDGPNHDNEGTEVELEGALGALGGSCPAIHFTVGSSPQVAASASTTFDGVACSSLKNGDKVSVKGTKKSDGSVAATRIRRK